MNIFDLSEKYRQSASKSIIEIVLPLPETQVDEDALKIILFATEKGLSCRKTAEAIADVVKNSANLKEDFFYIIDGLGLNIYFTSTPEISDLIRSYLLRVSPEFKTQKDIELYEELISEPANPHQPEENSYEPI
ncbi:MAG: hypothetical protein ACD_7C00302G0012 [uncultured bacterium]|nr:MAG: hypothetical protein ACD_7C00302G0012 [uncultured bacterium]HBR79601.1 hypothetical protein [Candidatus Moranbacteria bacterium]